jgi:predicted Na+-dependent transporter
MIEVLIGVCATVVMWALVGYMIGRDLASSDKTPPGRVLVCSRPAGHDGHHAGDKFEWVTPRGD